MENWTERDGTQQPNFWYPGELWHKTWEAEQRSRSELNSLTSNIQESYGAKPGKWEAEQRSRSLPSLCENKMNGLLSGSVYLMERVDGY